MKPRAIAFLVLLLTIATPSVALANAGTPLMNAGALHLMFGNAVIGMLEGALLHWIYRVHVGRACVLMVLANYFSAWLGWLSLPGLLHDHVEVDLYNAWWILWGMVVVAYVVTLVLEWPFVAACFWGQKQIFRRSCGASLLVQTVSYLLLFGWFGLASRASLYGEISVVPLNRLSLPDNVLVYYIGDVDGDVYRMELKTGRTEKVFELGSQDRDDCLSFSTDGRKKQEPQEIVALFDSGNINEPKEVRMGISVPEGAYPSADQGSSIRRRRWVGPIEGDAFRLGDARESPWKFEAAFWPYWGLSGENARTGEHVRVAFETPFIQWAARAATLLPGDRVVFQLGPRQICIFEPDTRRVAVLAFGRGPVAVLEKPPAQ